MRHVSAAFGLPDDIKERFCSIVRENVIFKSSLTFEHEFYEPKSNVVAYWSTNEPQGLIDQNQCHTKSFGVGSFDQKELLSLEISGDLHTIVNASSGRYSAICINLEKNELAIASTMARIDCLHIYNGENFVIVSPFANVIDAVLKELEKDGYERDGNPLSPFSSKFALNGDLADRAYSFLSAGFFCDDYTVYKSIEAFIPSTTMIVSNSGKQIECDYFDKVTSSAFYIGNYSQAVSAIASSLIEASKNFENSNGKPVNLLLSGGMDSRLLAAALSKSEIAFNATTFDGGAANAADVYCAKLTAETLGIDLAVKPRFKTEAEASPDKKSFEIRTHQTNKVSDFSIIALGNLPFNPKYTEQISINGMGGEIIRGGYAKSALATARFKDAESFLISKWVRFNSFFHEGFHEEYVYGLSEFLEAHDYLQAEEQIEILLESAYLWVRQGRWASTIARVGTMSRNVQYPFLVNSFVEKVFAIDANRRLNDQLHFDILKEFDEGLANIPFANDHYEFLSENEKKQLEEIHPNAFLSPIKDTGKKLDWRADWLAQVGNIIKNQLLAVESKDSELKKIIDWEKLEMMFTDDKLNRGHRFPLFAMYSLSLALSNSRIDSNY